MKVLSAADANVLALIAENPVLAGRDLDYWKSRISSPEAQEIAAAIVQFGTAGVAMPLSTTNPIWDMALGILNWARGNKPANEIAFAGPAASASNIR